MTGEDVNVLISDDSDKELPSQLIRQAPNVETSKSGFLDDLQHQNPPTHACIFRSLKKTLQKLFRIRRSPCRKAEKGRSV